MASRSPTVHGFTPAWRWSTWPKRAASPRAGRRGSGMPGQSSGFQLWAMTSSPSWPAARPSRRSTAREPRTGGQRQAQILGTSDLAGVELAGAQGDAVGGHPVVGMSRRGRCADRPDIVAGAHVQGLQHVHVGAGLQAGDSAKRSHGGRLPSWVGREPICELDVNPMGRREPSPTLRAKLFPRRQAAPRGRCAPKTPDLRVLRCRCGPEGWRRSSPPHRAGPRSGIGPGPTQEERQPPWLRLAPSTKATTSARAC